MFALTSDFCYYLYHEPTDMRKSFDGLSGLIQNRLKRPATNGEVFMFINKRRDRIKLLRWEDDGFLLYYKRLEEGTFELPGWDHHSSAYVMSWSDLFMMLKGISFKSIHYRKRVSKMDHYQQNQPPAVGN